MSRSPWDEAKARRRGGAAGDTRPGSRPDAEGRPRGRDPSRPSGDRRADDASSVPHALRRDPELRVYGVNACMAAFKRRPQDLRKVYLSQQRMSELREVMAFCVEHRLGYRLVENDDLNRLAGSQHHEGVCFDMRWPTLPTINQLLAKASNRCLLVWLDGVGNPHNLGAILRSAAHFGVTAVLSPSRTGIRLSGAAARVAEGGAESVPLIALDDPDGAWLLLKVEGFTRIATLPAGENSVFKADLPGRTVFVLGAEQSGMRSITVDSCDQQLAIPGSGEVESLNVASAASVFFAEWARRWG